MKYEIIVGNGVVKSIFKSGISFLSFLSVIGNGVSECISANINRINKYINNRIFNRGYEFSISTIITIVLALIVVIILAFVLIKAVDIGKFV